MTTPTEADFVVLYRENYSDVERFVARRADPARVDDIVGETFLAAWRRRAELPGEPRPWLFRTARNTILNAHRGERRQRAVAVRIAATSVFEVSDPTSSVDASLDVVGAWQRLDERDQEVLALHVWDDLDDRDAAAVLGCSRAAYAMRLTRARRRLARLLQTDTASLSYAPLVPKEQS
jgi:RNA polymerase sigma factor (sigma-70 family)